GPPAVLAPNTLSKIPMTDLLSPIVHIGIKKPPTDRSIRWRPDHPSLPPEADSLPNPRKPGSIYLLYKGLLKKNQDGRTGMT
ncbi:MAG: hypothetical protein ACM32K_03435, partial [Syntrophaceae bacterium]